VALFENQNSTDKGKMTAYLRPVDPDFQFQPANDQKGILLESTEVIFQGPLFLYRFTVN
jgi:hypothetical protein